jgi:hypothetical protein
MRFSGRNAGYRTRRVEGVVTHCPHLAAAALLRDLELRGLLEDTLVVWSGEFGRTPMRENRGGVNNPFVGRDHNPSAFTIWMAGGGVKRGFEYGLTDDIGYTVAEHPVAIQDLHATILHLLGFDHDRFTFPAPGGIQQKLTTVTKHADVIRQILRNG